jgi:hypothetical protein
MFALRQFRLPLCSIRSIILARNMNELQFLRVQTRHKVYYINKYMYFIKLITKIFFLFELVKWIT